MVESYLNRQKTLWEKEKLLVTNNFFFSQGVFKRLELQTRKNQGLFGKGLNLTLYHIIPTFGEAFLKTLWDKEKVLVSSIFSFSHNVFYSFKKDFLFLSYIYFVVCKCFQFGKASNLIKMAKRY